MHENAKLREARHFYEQMRAAGDDRKLFEHNLSAFLSAGRSVLLYAYEETKANKNLKWYDDQLTNPTLRYFREKRNSDIHAEPVRPNQVTSATITGTARIVAPISPGADSAAAPVPAQSTPPPKLTHRFFFADSRDKDVLASSELYLQELEKFIKIGVDRGFLTPSKT